MTDFADHLASGGSPVGTNPKVRRYGGDREAKPAFVFQIGESPEITIYEPDAGTVMDIEEATNTRQVLQLFAGEQYAVLEEYLEPLHPDVMVELARDISRHFGLFDTSSATNRAQRRRRTRN